LLRFAAIVNFFHQYSLHVDYVIGDTHIDLNGNEEDTIYEIDNDPTCNIFLVHAYIL